MAQFTGVRERARAATTAELLAVARQHLASDGAAGLSLRAVARDVGIASSGVYRYFPSRDDLLSRLITEADDALGEAAEREAEQSARLPPAERFAATCRAIRAWALQHRHEYALLYGTPVPGYDAPTDAIGPATRPSRALLDIIAETHARGRLAPPIDRADAVPPGLRADLERARAELRLNIPDDVFVRAITAWTHVFGLVSFELLGQTAGVITDHAALFDTTTSLMASFLGL